MTAAWRYGLADHEGELYCCPDTCCTFVGTEPEMTAHCDAAHPTPAPPETPEPSCPSPGCVYRAGHDLLIFAHRTR